VTPLPLRIFIGYDPREAVAYHVLAHSILTRASVPVSITPLARHALRWIHTRKRGPLESTDFSITRFLVPYLCQYEGDAIYMDCDMLCLTDITQVMDSANDESVLLCPHLYTPTTPRKFFDQPNIPYPRKNWSSLMVFNNARCRALTPEYVNTAPGLDLHRFLWLPDEEIGCLPLEWNWLVGEYEPNPLTKILHYTLGGPWLYETRDCDHAKEWWDEYHLMTGGVHADR